MGEFWVTVTVPMYLDIQELNFVHGSRSSSFPMMPLLSICQDIEESGRENSRKNGVTNPELLI